MRRGVVMVNGVGGGGERERVEIWGFWWKRREKNLVVGIGELFCLYCVIGRRCTARERVGFGRINVYYRS